MAVGDSSLRPLYAVLGVPADASQEVIKRAYRRLALEHHPDKQQAAPSSDTFAKIALAYEVLGHEQRRRRYDLSGEMPQSDAALGRAAGETFLAEYLASAPKVERGATQAEWSLHSLENYEILEVDGKDVPEYMRGIVMIGLGYLVKVVPDMEEKQVVLLRHFVMDQMYALMAYTPPLDATCLEERGYIITYYDHPLQAGIKPTWSDQNGLDKGGGSASIAGRSEMRAIDQATVERRQLAALEWLGKAPSAPSSQPAPRAVVPGEGVGTERLLLAAKALVKLEPDLGSFDIHRLRRELARVLGTEASALDGIGSSSLMTVVFEAVEEADDEGAGGDAEEAAAPVAAVAEPPSKGQQAALGAQARVRETGRVGEVALHDPEDSDLTFKLRFADGGSPAEDWFSARAVELLMAG